jgi:hypothetical protein
LLWLRSNQENWDPGRSLDELRGDGAAEPPGDGAEEPGAPRPDNDHEGVLLVGEVGQDAGGLAATRLVRPEPGEVNQHPGCVTVFSLNTSRNFGLQVGCIWVRSGVGDVDDLDNVKVSLQKARELGRPTQCRLGGRPVVKPDY